MSNKSPMKVASDRGTLLMVIPKPGSFWRQKGFRIGGETLEVVQIIIDEKFMVFVRDEKSPRVAPGEADHSSCGIEISMFLAQYEHVSFN